MQLLAIWGKCKQKRIEFFLFSYSNLPPPRNCDYNSFSKRHSNFLSFLCINPYVIYGESNVIFSRVYMFGRCIITWFILSLKVFIAFYRIFTYFKIYLYWVDIPEFIFWMKLWILWKDTDVSFFFDCSMFLVSNISVVSIRLYALWEAMQNRWGGGRVGGYAHEDSYEEGRFFFSFQILQESPS